MVVAVLYLAAFLLARRRPRMSVTIGLLVVANALPLAFTLSVGRQLVIDQFAGTVLAPASAVFFDTLVSYLDRGWQVFLWLGVILVLAGLYAGSSRAGTAVRGAVRQAMEGVGAQLADGPLRAAGTWVRTNQRWLRFAVGTAGSVVLLWGVDVSVARLFWSLVAVLLALTVIQVLVGAGSAAPANRPDSPGAPSVAPASPTEQVLADAETTVPSDRK